MAHTQQPSTEQLNDCLKAHASRLQKMHLGELLADPNERFAAFSCQVDDLTLDFSRERLDRAALDDLLGLALAHDVEDQRARMFAGDAVNRTEGRAALHMALRGGAPDPTGGEVVAVRERFLAYAENVRRSDIRDVIHIGIGGSDLGPSMAVKALAADHDGPRIHFVSNVDGAHFADTVRDLDPGQTLVIIASKTFTTQETMANAALAKAWLGDGADMRMAAVSTNLAACAEFGIPAERVFGFWDWVGGRYSVWSAIGLPLAIAIGAEKFRAFLDGAAAMDRHFQTAPLRENLPVLMALIGIWRRNFMGWPTLALLPYDQRLSRFAAHIQQLEMESNGKSVRQDGSPVPGATAPVIWGEAGTNAQHSFFQLLHQGTDIVPADFIVAARPRGADEGHHRLLLANCLAQAEALATGQAQKLAVELMIDNGLDMEEARRLAPHKTFPGNRPSTILLYRELSPSALGRLIALYEHKIAVQAMIWRINAFDQWGVELGKAMAKSLLPDVETAFSGRNPGDSVPLLHRLSDLQSD